MFTFSFFLWLEKRPENSLNWGYIARVPHQRSHVFWSSINLKGAGGESPPPGSRLLKLYCHRKENCDSRAWWISAQVLLKGWRFEKNICKLKTTELICFIFWSTNVIQWGSEYRASLVFKWLMVVRSPNGQLFECHLNTQQNLFRYSDHHLNTRHLNIGQVKVCYSDVSVIQVFDYSDPHSI